MRSGTTSKGRWPSSRSTGNIDATRSTGGPPTLSVKASGKGCYTATAFDDNAKAATVSGLQWHVGSKKTAPGTTGTAYCPGKHTGTLVRATATGAVRSNAVK